MKFIIKLAAANTINDICTSSLVCQLLDLFTLLEYLLQNNFKSNTTNSTLLSELAKVPHSEMWMKSCFHMNYKYLQLKSE